MLHAKNVPEETMTSFLQDIIDYGFNIRQAIRISDDPHKVPHNDPRDPIIEGAILLIAIEKTETKVLQYLLGQDFINVWGQSHLEMVLETFNAEGLHNNVELVLSS